MIDLDDKTLSEEQVWDWFIETYKKPSRIGKMLSDNFYSKINLALQCLPSNGKILEIGCGPGESSERLLKFMPKATFEFSEFDQRLVNKLREFKPHLNVRQESVMDLQRQNNEFDCLIMLEVLEHLEDYHKALQEIFRVTEKYALLSVPNEPIWRLMNMLRLRYLKYFGNTPGHINHWSSASFVKLISNYAEVIKVYNPLPWTIILAKKK